MGYFLCFHDAFTYPDSIPFDGVVHRVSDFLKLYETPNAALQSTTCSQQNHVRKKAFAPLDIKLLTVVVKKNVGQSV